MKEKKEDLIYGPDSCDVNSLLWLISCFKFDKSSKLELEWMRKANVPLPPNLYLNLCPTMLSTVLGQERTRNS